MVLVIWCQSILIVLLFFRISSYIQYFTLHDSVRPFGSSVILASYDKSGPGLYMIEPSGVSYVSRIYLFFQF